MQYRDVSLGLAGSLFKHPLLAYAKSDLALFSAIGIVEASDLDGTAWNAPLELNNGGYTTALGWVDGVPALCCGAPSSGGVMNYARADDNTGTAWSAGLTPVGAGGYGSLVIYNGNPATCSYNLNDGNLYFASASDADGTAWNPPYIVDSAGDVGGFCSMVVVNGTPVICYADRLGKQLKAAYFE